MNKALHILLVNTLDQNGGAARIAWTLFQESKKRGHHSWFAVGHKRSSEDQVFEIPNEAYKAKTLAEICRRLMQSSEMRMGRMKWLARLFGRLAGIILAPRRYYGLRMGSEDFDYPGSRHLLEIVPEKPDIIHGHNLHGGYFDVRVLPKLSKETPIVLTLHDAWLLSGNCAHSFECERWVSGCGQCPDISIPPGVPKDSTGYNWARKKRIYKSAHLYVATPSQWLLEKVERSMLKPAIRESKVIHNGIDLSIFRPVDKSKVRGELGLSEKGKVMLFTSNGIRQSIWKDFDSLKSALLKLSDLSTVKDMTFIGLGEEGSNETVKNLAMRFVPYQRNAQVVASYYQAADVYVHPARAETFPTTILEALACGTPVVATNIGGIPEQVEDGKTGFLVRVGDPEALLKRIRDLLEGNDLLAEMSHRASQSASRKFGADRMVEDYLSWYDKIVDDWRPAGGE